MKYWIVLAFCLCSFLAHSQIEDVSFKLKGFADTYHSVRSKKPYDFMSSRSRLRTELTVANGNSHLFTSLNSIYNGLDESQSKIELREVFFQYSSKNLDFKAGKQIICWGVADGLRITDIVSPMDYSEFLARDYDDIRIPVNALRLKFVKPRFNLETVYIPISDFFILPTDPDNPWSITQSYQMPSSVILDNTPSKHLHNAEYGGRFSLYLNSVDLSFSALRTWNKMPVFQTTYSANMDSLIFKGHYARLDMLGMDMSIPLGKFVIRWEAAGYLKELVEASDYNGLVKKNTANLMVGLDWYPGSDWTIILQYYQKHIDGYTANMTVDENTIYGTVNISKSLFRSTLKLSTYSYIDIPNEAIFNRSYIEYILSDQIHLLAGYDLFNGDKGTFATYKNNSEYWVKAKFCF